MEAIRSISCSIPENNDNQHFVDNPADLPCTSTQNVQNTNVSISLLKESAKKTQDEVINKLDAPLRFKKIKINKKKQTKFST